MKADTKQSNIIGIRFNDATLEKLDRIVERCGYKSRSDCIKSLIEVKYVEESTVEQHKSRLLELLNQDPEVRAAILSIVESARTPAYIGDKEA